MKLSMEKEFFVNESGTTEVEYFNLDLKEIYYDDFMDFISDFINDTEL